MYRSILAIYYVRGITVSDLLRSGILALPVLVEHLRETISRYREERHYMKLYYIANARMQTEMAHGIQIAKMCEAFAALGNEVTLVLPALGARTDLFTAYGVQKNFRIHYLPALNLPLRLPGAFALLVFSFAIAVRVWLLKQRGEAVIYTRGETSLFIEPFLPRRYALVWETHIKPRSPMRYRRVAHRALALIAVTKYYADEIPALWGISSTKVLYAPDAVDVDDFLHPEPTVVARKRLCLSLDKKIALYAGRIDSWKGVDTLLEASELLPENIQIVIIGGTEEQILQLRPRYPRVRFLGYRPYAELPDNQSAADVLVLTGDPSSATARFYTSPLKLFTYMASGIPIIAADLPSFRDVLSEREVFFFEPNATELAEAILFAIAHPEDASGRASAARQKVQAFSWAERARAISAFVV